MAENRTSGKSLLFWLAIFAAVAVAIFLIAKFLFPQMVEKTTAFIAGLFVVATGLVFRRKRKNG
jgi:LPXTG-motif cell wall-anchored protein